MGSRRLVIVAAGLGFAVVGPGIASAITISADRGELTGAPHSARVGDSAEAWYSIPTGSVCLPFVGCLPLPVPLPGTLPAGTLHVGVTLGKESSRSYVVPAIAAPKGDEVTGGQLRLPVDSDPTAGTLDAGSARIKVCLTTGKLPAGASAKTQSAGAPPSIDCGVSAAASFDRAGNYFYVDLRPFLMRWQHGTPNRGVAVVPNVRGGSPLANWHVALLGKGAASPGTFSLLTYSPAAAPKPAATRSPTCCTGPPVQQAGPPIDIPLPGATGTLPAASAPAVAPPAQSAVYFVRSKGFRYPAIFAAPLAILAGVIFFSRLFTGSNARPRTRTTIGAESSDG